MEGSALQKLAGIAACLVGISSLAFGLVFVFAIPDAQKGPAPGALMSYVTNPAPVQVAFVLVIVGALSALVAVVGIARLLHAYAAGWAVLSHPGERLYHFDRSGCDLHRFPVSLAEP